MENKEINDLDPTNLAGSGEFERERVENLRKEWHAVDTAPFATRSAGFGRRA